LQNHKAHVEHQAVYINSSYIKPTGTELSAGNVVVRTQVGEYPTITQKGTGQNRKYRGNVSGTTNSGTVVVDGHGNGSHGEHWIHLHGHRYRYGITHTAADGTDGQRGIGNSVDGAVGPLQPGNGIARKVG